MVLNFKVYNLIINEFLKKNIDNEEIKKDIYDLIDGLNCHNILLEDDMVEFLDYYFGDSFWKDIKMYIKLRQPGEVNRLLNNYLQYLSIVDPGKNVDYRSIVMGTYWGMGQKLPTMSSTHIVSEDLNSSKITKSNSLDDISIHSIYLPESDFSKIERKKISKKEITDILEGLIGDVDIFDIIKSDEDEEKNK